MIDVAYPPEEFAKRDAIHVAIFPAVAGGNLKRGQRVSVSNGVAEPDGFGCDIVNPFCNDDEIPCGERVWIFLCPDTVTHIRHHWTHPNFDAEDSSNDSELWLRWFASRIGMEYDDMIAVTTRWCDGGDCWVQLGSETARDEYNDFREPFWEHFQAVTGKTRPEDSYGGPFSCSC